MIINLPLPRENNWESYEDWARNLKNVLEDYLLKIVSGQIVITNVQRIGTIPIDLSNLQDGAKLVYDKTNNVFKLEV